MGSIDRSLSKYEAPRLSADFDRPLSCERPFKLLRHLIQVFAIVETIPNYGTNLL